MNNVRTWEWSDEQFIDNEADGDLLLNHLKTRVFTSLTKLK